MIQQEQPLPDEVMIEATIRAARRGKAGAIEQFESLARDYPEHCARRLHADLHQLAVDLLTSRLGGDDMKGITYGIALEAKLRALADRLRAEAPPSAAVDLVVEAVVFAWAEYWAAAAMANGSGGGDGWQKRENAAQRRYLTALQRFAQIARLEQRRSNPAGRLLELCGKGE
jgi:hypothetical protein